jgi:hypothetical protein
MLDACCRHNPHPRVRPSLPWSDSPRPPFPSPQKPPTVGDTGQRNWARPSRAPFGQPPAGSRHKTGTRSEQVRDKPFTHKQLSTRRGAGPTGQRDEPRPWPAPLPAARGAGARLSQERLGERKAAPPPCRTPSPSLWERRGAPKARCGRRSPGGGEGRFRAGLVLSCGMARPTSPEQVPNRSGTRHPATKQSLACRPSAPARPGSKNRPPTGPQQGAQPQPGPLSSYLRLTLYCLLPAAIRKGAPNAPRRSEKEQKCEIRRQEESETERDAGPSVRFALSRTFALSQFLPGSVRFAARLPLRTRPGTSREQVPNRPSRHRLPLPPARRPQPRASFPAYIRAPAPPRRAKGPARVSSCPGRLLSGAKSTPLLLWRAEMAHAQPADRTPRGTRRRNGERGGRSCRRGQPGRGTIPRAEPGDGLTSLSTLIREGDP